MPEVLFDLDRDPGETVNVLDRADYAGAVEAFRQRGAELGFGGGSEPVGELCFVQ